MLAVRPRLLLMAALAGAAGLVGVIALSRDPAPSTPANRPVTTPPTDSISPRHVPPAAATTAASNQAATRTVSAAAKPPTLDDVLAPSAPTATLIAGIDAPDAVIVAESVNALVARAAVSALPALIAQNIVARPKAAPSILYGIGRLAAVAEPDARDAAVDRLVALMAEEKRRAAQESQGNLLQIYEALGDSGAPSAIAPLERELLDASVPTAPKVVIVNALVALHAVQSRGTLEQLAAQLTASTATGLEGELRRELLTVIQQALVQLS